MKKLFLSIFVLLITLSFSTSIFAQTKTQKEVLIIGTMHTVPKIVQNSYRPLLKQAQKYQPQAIYVEYPMATDTLSIKNDMPKFYASVDSLQQVLPIDELAVQLALQKELQEMTREDFALLSHYYGVQMDYANKEYFRYLHLYGVEGASKPLRNENADLTAKLAINQGLTKIYSMDNQWYQEEYHQAWQECALESQKDEETKQQSQIIKNITIRGYLNALTGRYGKFINSDKTQTQFHTLNSFRYRETACESCELGKFYWDERNTEMARNIGNQIRQNAHQRSVVVVGSGHVVGLQEVLTKEFPEIKVELLRER